MRGWSSGEWSRWVGLEAEARSIAAQVSYSDGLEVFTVGLDDEIRHRWCDRLDLPWKEWMLLDYEASPLRQAINAPS
jgi:hypothetical protein